MTMQNLSFFTSFPQEVDGSIVTLITEKWKCLGNLSDSFDLRGAL
jgi:hypothetical protein